MEVEKMALHRCGAKIMHHIIDYQRHNALASTIQMQKCIEYAPCTMHAAAKTTKKKKKGKENKME